MDYRARKLTFGKKADQISRYSYGRTYAIGMFAPQLSSEVRMQDECLEAIGRTDFGETPMSRPPTEEERETNWQRHNRMRNERKETIDQKTVRLANNLDRLEAYKKYAEARGFSREHTNAQIELMGIK